MLIFGTKIQIFEERCDFWREKRGTFSTYQKCKQTFTNFIKNKFENIRKEKKISPVSPSKKNREIESEFRST